MSHLPEDDRGGEEVLRGNRHVGGGESDAGRVQRSHADHLL